MAIRPIDGSLKWAIDDVTGKLHVINQDGSDAGEIDFGVMADGDSVEFSWKFNTTTTEADPGAKTFRMNNATPASVTEVYISATSNSGTDISPVFNALKAGDKFYIQQIDTAGNFVLLNITSVTDNTGWFKLVVTVDDSGTIFGSAKDCGTSFFFSSSRVTKVHSITSDAAWKAALDNVIANPGSFNQFKVSADLSLGGGDLSAGTVRADIHVIADQTSSATRPKITDISYSMTVGDANIIWDGVDYLSDVGDANNFFNTSDSESFSFEGRNSDFSSNTNMRFIEGKNDSYTAVKLINCTGTMTNATTGFFATNNNGFGTEKEILDLILIGCNFSGLLASGSDTVEELNIKIINSVISNNGNGVWSSTGSSVINVNYTPSSKVDQTLASGSSAVNFTEDFKIPGNQVAPWGEIGKSKYTATPASTSTITMSDTSDFFVGAPLRYEDSGGPFYAVVTAIVADTTITIAGAALDTGDDLTKLEVAKASQVVTMSLFVSGTYGDGVEPDLLRDDMNSPFRWKNGKAFLVAFEASQTTVDTGTEPKLNVEVNDAAVSTNDTNLGLQLGAANTWVKNSAVAISSANYDINYDEELELSCTAAGGTGDAADLTALLTFVLER